MPLPDADTDLLNGANTNLDNLGVSAPVSKSAMSRQEKLAILNRDIAKVRGSNARTTGM